MRNHFAAAASRYISYNKDLKTGIGSVKAAILMHRLDFWFATKGGEQFYKFFAPSENNARYKPGDSWEEEIGFTWQEFKTAFGKIGVTYQSKKEYDDEKGDKFQGKFYCRYYDKLQNVTYYFRNHDVVDDFLDKLVLETCGVNKSLTLGTQQNTNHGLNESLTRDSVNLKVDINKEAFNTTTDTQSHTAKNGKSRKKIATDKNEVILLYVEKGFNREWLESEWFRAEMWYEARSKKLNRLSFNNWIIKSGVIPGNEPLVEKQPPTVPAAMPAPYKQNGNSTNFQNSNGYGGNGRKPNHAGAEEHFTYTPPPPPADDVLDRLNNFVGVVAPLIAKKQSVAALVENKFIQLVQPPADFDVNFFDAALRVAIGKETGQASEFLEYDLNSLILEADDSAIKVLGL